MENPNNNKNIETYADDLAKAVEGDEPGLIKKIIDDQEEKEKFNENYSPTSKKNKSYMLISLVLIILALVVFYLIMYFHQEIFTANVAPQYSPLIFTNQNQFLEVGGLNKDQIAQTVSNEINKMEIKTGGIEGIYLTENKKVIGFKEFIKLINGNITPDQMNPVNDNFLIGGTNNNIVTPSVSPGSPETATSTDPSARDTLSLSEKKPFFLLKTISFVDVFSTMKAWEIKMLFDLHGFFGIYLNTDTNYLFTKDFDDGFIGNKNARILHDKDGNIVLMYIYVNDNSVVITDNETTANEIMAQLAASKIGK